MVLKEHASWICEHHLLPAIGAGLPSRHPPQRNPSMSGLSFSRQAVAHLVVTNHAAALSSVNAVVQLIARSLPKTKTLELALRVFSIIWGRGRFRTCSTGRLAARGLAPTF